MGATFDASDQIPNLFIGPLGLLLDFRVFRQDSERIPYDFRFCQASFSSQPLKQSLRLDVDTYRQWHALHLTLMYDGTVLQSAVSRKQTIHAHTLNPRFTRHHEGGEAFLRPTWNEGIVAEK